MVDIPLGGSCFTWSDTYGSNFSKLDRFMITKVLLHFFSSYEGVDFGKKLLDHHPIILIEHSVDYGLITFHMFHSWFELDEFVGLFEVLGHIWWMTWET